MTSHLGQAAVACRIADRVGCHPPDTMVDLVHQQSGGLPALVDLVTFALQETGRFDPRHPEQFKRPTRITVSVALAEQLRHRVDALEPAVRDLLEAMALGATLDVDVLGPLLAGTPHDLDAAVEAARATGLLTEAGELIPLIRNLFLRLTPVLRRRDLQRRLAGIELDRGGSVLAAGRQLLGTNASGSRIAAVFEAAAAEVLDSAPGLAAELLSGAVEAGKLSRDVAGRRARAFALVGDLDGALRHADQVISDPTAPDREQAVATAAAVLAHRGLLGRSADLHRSLPPSGALLAVPALVAIGAIDEARETLGAARADAGRQATTLVAGAAMLMAQGMVTTVTGSAHAALSQLSRAVVLLEPVASTALLPDSPAALAAVVAMQCGEVSVADAALRRAIESGHGGRAAHTRHRLLHGWLMMSRGGLNLARNVLDQVARPGMRLELRDEFVAAALAVALARRADGAGALAATWSRARDALVQYPVDLAALPQLGELAVATALLGEGDWLAAHLEEADLLLDRIGRPPLWAAPMHWFRLQAAVAADRPAELAHHAAALRAAAGASPYAAVLAAAAACWEGVLACDVEPEELVTVGRRMRTVGLGWEAAQLAGRAASVTGDRRSSAGLHAFARTLQSTIAGTDSTGAGGALPASIPGTADGPGDDPDAETAPHDGSPGSATPSAAPNDDAPTFSERELEIGRFILAGLTYKQIGQRLFISAKTVEHHVARMRQRLGVASREALFDQLRSAVGTDGPTST